MAGRQRRGSRAAAARRLPRHRLQRGGPAARRHHSGIDLGHARVSVPAALGAPPVARRRRRAHPEGTGSSTRETRGYRLQFMRSLDRPIFMDGRPHPPAWAPHSWSGFSTGEWLGHTLKVTTTHLKDGYLKRGGPQTSDMLTMTEFITRHDDILTDRPGRGRPDLPGRAVRAVDHLHVRSERAARRRRTAPARRSPRTAARDRHWVPHFLPGQNSGIGEFLKDADLDSVRADPRRRQDACIRSTARS